MRQTTPLLLLLVLALIAPAAAAAQTPPLRVITANVPFPLNGERARAQIEHAAFNSGAHVAVIQEVRQRKIKRIFKQVWEARGKQPGERFRVFKLPGATDSNAIAWRPQRLRLLGQGSRLAFPSDGGQPARHLLWIAVRDRVTRQRHTIIGLHYPTGASHGPTMRRLYKTMNGNYRTLVGDLRASGLHPVAGGDWNHPLDVRREPWSPVPFNRRMKMTTNWRVGTPCAGGTSDGGRIDGFAFDNRRTRIIRQTCLSRLHSDHRPVWIEIRTRR
jgi:hypothetical protein